MRKKKKSKRLSFTLGAQTNYAANLPVIKTFQQSQSCVRDGGGGDLFGWECDPASIWFQKKKNPGHPILFFLLFLGVSLSLTCTHYNVSCPFFPTGNQSAEGGKVWHVLRPETIQLGARLAFAGGPFNIILSRLDLILFFWIAYWYDAFSAVALQWWTLPRWSGRSSRRFFWFFSLPTPVCGPRFVTQCGC